MTAACEITAYLLEQFASIKVNDFSNNGIQCEGAAQVTSIGFAVDACTAVFEEAARRKCQYLFCHHGISWGGGIQRATKYNYRRLKMLIQNDITLMAMHLPLDAHPVIGNNAVIADMLGIPAAERGPFGIFQGNSIGFDGFLPQEMSIQELAAKLNCELNTFSRVYDFRNSRPIRSVGIVSGGGAGTIDEAADKGLDCLITGEMAHQHYHYAKEQGLDVIAAGHYATETTGPKAVMALVQRQFPSLKCHFIDLPTGL